MIDLKQGDCLELMQEIPDDTVDMILCDLPYHVSECKWDNIIPIDRLWAEYRRIIKKNGIIALFGSEPFSTKLRTGNMDWYKYDWIWEKNTSTGFVHAKNMPMRVHENISVFSPASIGHKSLLGERRMPYNPQGTVRVNKISKTSTNKFGTIVGTRPSHKKEVVRAFEHYPNSVLRFKKTRVTNHPSEKPVPLLEYLILTYTSPEETVLDNCMGSGTTGVACIHTGRNFIGMELDEEYFQMAKNRISEAESDGTQMTMDKLVMQDS